MEGKGPTPKAVDRDHHPAARRARAAAKQTGSSRPSTGGNRSNAKRSSNTAEMVAGRNPVVEALRAGVPAKALYVAARIDSDERVREAIKTAADAGLPLLEASRTDLDRLTNGAVHQGLVLQVNAYEYAHPDDLLELAAQSGRPPLLVVLDGVTDPRNLGAVVRSVAAFGGHGVIVPERRAAGMTATAWKTSAGAAARTPVARVSNVNRAIESLKAAGCFVVGLDAGGDVQLPGLDLATGPLVLVAGAEGKGLSRLVRENCDAIASIPMIGGTESLNASVAMGVSLYEVSRLRAE
ncbi:23S rRNA (guanosine(2251)-2'-O)-methyltransferase RlmB [Kineosporia babensis]|uniref:23S rRNA (Guanosine(2251)-2'-O)-methyltransferase RlmB n=1 Tax=Kineosporia babensis TaxID=499548 RepID=A0A9X1N8U9_9ACTN|nr:23S rRNA (guanosine(2251)-2'-O)-methyltransferase RlmB [Kineosporia babensis]MCD5309270.1 23S rRNA (guanosine(2251)-2'-O)-methyltransferase RlmB [Kineosporia babensis]